MIKTRVERKVRRVKGPKKLGPSGKVMVIAVFNLCTKSVNNKCILQQ